MQTSGYPVIGDKVPNPCEEVFDLVAYFSGATNAVPVMELGNIVLRGATMAVFGSGIGASGHLLTDEFAFDFGAILKGGAGVKVRCCTTPQKKKVRFRVLASDACSINSGRIGFQIRPVSNCLRPVLYDDILPVLVMVDSCVGTDEKKAKAAVAMANQIPYNNTVATAVQIGTGWYIEVEAKDIYTDFYVTETENVEIPTEVFSYTTGGFFAKNVNSWFRSNIVGECDADKCLPGLQIHFAEYVPFKGMGSFTSNPAQHHDSYVRQLRSVTVLYDSAVSNATTAYTALVALLNNSDQALKRMSSTTCEDLVPYPFTIVRVDAGDASALTAADGAYAVSGKTSFSRLSYNSTSGKSVYLLKKTNATALTPDANGSNPDDVTYFGYANSADIAA